jgi:hypothetical protein
MGMDNSSITTTLSMALIPRVAIQVINTMDVMSAQETMEFACQNVSMVNTRLEISPMVPAQPVIVSVKTAVFVTSIVACVMMRNARNETSSSPPRLVPLATRTE